MDKIHRLVSLVMRAFYSPEHCIIVDILMNVNTINDDDLAKQLNAKVKEVQLVCGLLKAHGLIKVESKTEGMIDHSIRAWETAGVRSCARKRVGGSKTKDSEILLLSRLQTIH